VPPAPRLKTQDSRPSCLKDILGHLPASNQKPSAKSAPKTIIVPPCQAAQTLSESDFPLRARQGCRYGDKITKPLQTLAWHDGTMFIPPRRGGKGNRSQTDGCGPGRPETSFFSGNRPQITPKSPRKPHAQVAGACEVFFRPKNLSKPLKTSQNQKP
jgi:hypothetical protein